MKKYTVEKMVEKLQELLEKKSIESLETVRKAVKEELKRIKCKEIKEALNYFINEYWLDITRPALLSMVSEAVGGKENLTEIVAVPLSLISGGIDIHDDIIDESERKYGKQTVYGKYGKDIALLVGDVLLFKGLLLLNQNEEISMEKRLTILNIIKDAFFELGDAEALELRFRKCSLPSVKEYLKVVEKKAADVEAHARIAAILSNANEKEIEVLGRYGRMLGMLIIIRDDVLDLLDDKELKNRILKEHLPLPILCASSKKDSRLRLMKILKKQRITKDDLKAIREITKKSGGLKATVEIIEEIAREASSIIKNIENPPNLSKLITTILYATHMTIKNA